MTKSAGALGFRDIEGWEDGLGAVIEEVRIRPIRVPLRRAWAPDVTHVTVIEVVVTASDQAVGIGFSWTPSIGSEAVAALLRHDIVPFVVGRPATPSIWPQAWEHLHEAGGGGLTTIALAGIDLALWDLLGRRRDLPFADLLGRRQVTQPVYASGVNLHYSLDELVAQVQAAVDAGYPAVKIKVGKPDLAEDVDRVEAVREVLGPDRLLMLDANQRWSSEQALPAVRELSRFSLTWMEEPLRSDDTEAYVRLRALVDVPIALGENVHTGFRFRDLITAGACDVIQPNIVRVGGITPFLQIAQVARDAGIELAPHLLPELSGQLAMVLAERTWVENVDGALFEDAGVLVQPTGCRIEDARFHPGLRPGLGFTFR